jgi:hypothetical protein
VTATITETEIANRALQRCGAGRIPASNDPTATLWTDDSKNASEIRACYHILRRAEQRRNIWTANVRRCALRPLDTTGKAVTFAAWAIGTTYAINDVVLGSDGQIYQSKVASNLAHDPTTTFYTYWTIYSGNLAASEYVTTWDAAITYAANDHAVGSDGTTYYSIAAGNINHNPVGDLGVHWTAVTDGTATTDTTFFAGEIVYIGNRVYLSKISANEDVPPSSNWLTFAGTPTVAPLNLIYPIDAGPLSQPTSKNVYLLPNGFLREAPQSPKAGSRSFLGGPSNNFYDDWVFENGFLISGDAGVIVFRFACDNPDPTTFDPMFVEGFSCRIGLEVAEPLTQSTSKLEKIQGEYKVFMTEARIVNGIEQGSVELPEDEYISVRL